MVVAVIHVQINLPSALAEPENVEAGSMWLPQAPAVGDVITVGPHRLEVTTREWRMIDATQDASGVVQGFTVILETQDTEYEFLRS